MFEDRKSFSNGVQFAWDSTSLGMALECQRKYYYRMVQNIVPQNQSVHLIFGGIYASALEHFYKLRSHGADLEEAIHSTVKLAMIKSWDAERNAPVVFEDDKKTRVTLIRTIVWYLDQFGDETDSAIKTTNLLDGTAAVEVSFALEFDDDILLCGHLDRIVDFGDSLYWMDQKTTGSTVGPYFFKSYEMSNQFHAYTWAGQVILKSPIRGGIIDAAQIALNFSRFERGFFTSSPLQLEEWRESMLFVIAQTQSNTLLNKWPMNFTACDKYGGCPYRMLCKSHPSVRPHIVESYYTTPEKPWDPLVPR